MTSRYMKVHEREYLTESVIIIDTREQRPLVFKNDYAETKTIATGDYSIEGPDGKSFLPGQALSVAVERKALDDLAACCSRERERFQNELERGAELGHFALVIEANYRDIILKRYISKIERDSILGSLTAWANRYKMPVWFAGDAVGAARITAKILKMYVKEQIVMGRFVVPEQWGAK